jgi:hypothetical protein
VKPYFAPLNGTASAANWDPVVLRWRSVAKFREADIDRLMGDTRVIRNRKKIEAIRENAREMLALDTEYKGFKRRQLVLPMDGRA